ncbi:head-tail connector protein [Tuberibacillus sp. Marseille-P3662]|uniref:head-tail connector protein n=1 Tax=Tuberibacillus sp. Marseille-P3662 TaxID=1965358 RepID=UPI000A1CB385|nr:head-tail connector protein [Tuberibacillus sp. Marseille-P3662]
MVELEDVKGFLRIDFNEDDNLINDCIKASDQFLKGAGCSDASAPELYNQAQKLLISNMYENRVPVVVGSTSSALDFSLQTIMLQLKADAPASDST